MKQVHKRSSNSEVYSDQASKDSIYVAIRAKTKRILRYDSGKGFIFQDPYSTIGMSGYRDSIEDCINSAISLGFEVYEI